MKKDDILIVGAVAMAAWMMLRGKGATAAPRPITVAQPGAGTVGGAYPLTSIADYIMRGLFPSSGSSVMQSQGVAAAANSNWLGDVSAGIIPDANNASVMDSAMNYGMSVDPNSLTGTLMSW
jgi:hypothetical protein